MRKNYFMKNVLTASMLLAVSMGMASCSGFVDAVLGTSDTPTTQPTTQPTTPTASSAVVTADQTTITISSFAELAKAISAEQNEEFVKAIEAKAAAGEVYTINIKSEQPLSTGDFEGFEIPRVENADVKLVFDKPIVTSESSPLVVTAEEKASTTSTTAVNKLTISMPDGSDDVYLKIDMPETSVTLVGAATYKMVESVTALETLIIGEGIDIETLVVKGGSLDIQGGSIDLLKIVNTKAETGISFGEGAIKKLVIADGATVNSSGKEDIPVEAIAGEGDSKILFDIHLDLRHVKDLSGVSFSPVEDSSHTHLGNIPDNTQDCEFTSDRIYNLGNNIKNCAFEAGWAIEGYNEYIENCTFKVSTMASFVKTSPVTFSNCKILINNDEPVRFSVPLDVETFIVNFENCELSEYGGHYIRIEPASSTWYVPVLDDDGCFVLEKGYSYRFFKDDTWWSTSTTDFQSIPEEIRNQGETSEKELFSGDPKEGYFSYLTIKYSEDQADSNKNFSSRVNLKNCTIGGSKATADMIGIRHYYPHYYGKCTYNIDGVDYEVVKNEGDDNAYHAYILKPIE